MANSKVFALGTGAVFFAAGAVLLAYGYLQPGPTQGKLRNLIGAGLLLIAAVMLVRRIINLSNHEANELSLK